MAQAIAKAKELAGEHTVAVTAGNVGGQALVLSLVDEALASLLTPRLTSVGQPLT